MKHALRAAERAATIETLRGHEGEAAAAYFAAIPAILPDTWRGDFVGRSRRPPRDRVNALPSFGYALLARDAAAALTRVGLDPLLGFLHAMIPGRPALALDLMEPFRAAWVDTAVLRLLAVGGIERADFNDLDRATLERRLLGVLNHRHDQILFVKLGPVEGPPTTPPRCSILGRPIMPGQVRTIVFF